MKIIILIAALVVSICIISTVAEEDEILTKFLAPAEESNTNRTVLESWDNMEKRMKKAIMTVIKMMLPVIIDNTDKISLSKECMNNGLHLMSGLKNIKPWAMRFLDSSGKIIDGLLVGTFSSFGSYDECVDTVVKSERQRDKGEILFRGQYCSIDLKPPLPPKKNFYKLHDVLEEFKNFSMRDTAVGEAAKFAQFFHIGSLRLGVCTPSGCTTEDVNKVTRLLGNELALNASTTRCEVKEENQFTPLIIIVITCYCFLGFLMLVGSLIDIHAYYRKTTYKSKFIRALLAFSLFTNFRKFINTETTSETLSCLHGMRFLCMTWVILGHTYALINPQAAHGLAKIRSYVKDFAFQAVINGTFSVDTFFVMGGFLVCYLTIKRVKIQGYKFEIGLYIFHRLWRILPVYALVMMFMFLANLAGSGPIWHDTTSRFMKGCYDNWWTNLIFINNFYDSGNMCIPQTWYLASDFQLYIGALLILLPMLRWPKVGISLTVTAIFACIIYSGVGTYIYRYPPGILVAFPDPESWIEYAAYFYNRPFVHIGPYCVGILAGYILATKPDLKMSRFTQILGWSLAFIINFTVLYGVAKWNSGEEPTFLAAMFYASCSRTAWGLGIAWMIVCCSTGHGGIINYILSLKAFVPLGRLTFVAYIVHPIVQLVYIGNIRTQIQLDHYIFVWMFFGHLCISYGIAFAGSMLIEVPFMTLEKIFYLTEKKVENNSLVKENNILNGSLKLEKNGDITAIIPVTNEEPVGVDNKCAIIYNL